MEINLSSRQKSNYEPLGWEARIILYDINDILMKTVCLFYPLCAQRAEIKSLSPTLHQNNKRNSLSLFHLLTALHIKGILVISNKLFTLSRNMLNI